MPEQDYPGGLYLLLILHYVEQECLAESSAAARPRNETIEQVCAYLAANYRKSSPLPRWRRGSTFPPTISAACSGG